MSRKTARRVTWNLTFEQLPSGAKFIIAPSDELSAHPSPSVPFIKIENPPKKQPENATRWADGWMTVIPISTKVIQLNM